MYSKRQDILEARFQVSFQNHLLIHDIDNVNIIQDANNKVNKHTSL